MGAVRTEMPATRERRRELLRAVSELIARNGIDGMSMRQVADAAGMSTGTINYHFKNKRGLIMAAMDYVYSAPQDWTPYADLPALDGRATPIGEVVSGLDTIDRIAQAPTRRNRNPLVRVVIE